MNILQETQSICGVCGTPCRAYYKELDGKVYFCKECPGHENMEVLAAGDAAAFSEWTSHSVVNIPPRVFLKEGGEGECPLHCGPCDRHLQTACCVILDVTERCNQSCPCCFARAGEAPKEDPSLSEINAWLDRLLELGEERPFNIQLSGGEPTVRDDLPDIIRLAREKGFEYVQINTNGRRLAEEPGYGASLAAAGASVIFLQFDGTRDSIYQELRGEPLLEKKNKAIEQCGLAGLPVTLVPTVVRGLNLDNIGEMVDFLLDRLGVVKGIHFQPVSFIGRHGYDEERQKLERVTMFQVMEELERQTGFRISTKGLVPISTGHPLCCFCGTYLRGQDGEIRSMMGEKARKEGVSCCDSADPLSIIRRDRDFVLNKWEVEPAAGWVEEPKSPCCCPTEAKEPEPCCCGGETASQTCCGQEEPDGFDEFLSYIRRNMFTVSGMAFQDLTNLDGERLRRCRVQVYTEEGQLVPFCAHQIHRG